MSADPNAAFLDHAIKEFRQLKTLADRALAQVDDQRFIASPDPESNSLAVLCRHVGGNLRSRWRDFLTTDGEKPDRHRDTEFELPAGAARAELLEAWERGWNVLFDELGKLAPGDLARTVTIRSEPHTVLAAIHRSLIHTAMHTGQIVYLAKHLAGADWRTLSEPRGRSEEFRQQMEKRFGKS